MNTSAFLRSFCALLFLSSAPLASAADCPTCGTVNFANRVAAAGLDAPVFDEDGVTRLAGNGYLAQLYASPIGGSLTAVGTAVPFVGSGYFSGGKVFLNGVAAGARARVQVRAWEAAKGSTYEQALAGGGKAGTSEAFEVTTGGDSLNPPAIPVTLLGLRSFKIMRAREPIITEQPADLTVNLGARIELRVAATGALPFTYQWRRNGTLVAGATSDRLVIAAATQDSDGLYEATVINAFGSAKSRSARVTVLLPPTFTTQPVGGTVIAGNTFNLTCAVSGSSPFTYQWRRNGLDVAGATSASLSLANIQPSQAGRYTVVARNAAGQRESAGADVVVHFGLELVQSDGGTLTATPAAASYAPGTSVRIEAKTNPGYRFEGWGGALSGTQNPITLTMNANKRVEGYFVATHGTVNFVNRVTTIGLDAPIYNDDGVTPLAGSAYLAQLYGAPVGGSLAPVGNPVPFLTSGYFSGGKTVIPTVPAGARAHVKVRAWDAAKGSTYEDARSSGGKVGESALLEVATGGDLLNPPTFPANLVGLRSFKIAVVREPVITEQPADATLVLGGTVELRVVATGSEPLRYQWKRNGTAISGATSSTLRLANVTPAADALYEVVVSNDFGSATSRAARVIVLIPPTISQQPTGGLVIAGNSLTLRVTAAGSAPLAYQWRKGGVNVPNATSSELILSGIQPAQAGRYTVLITNPAGQIESTGADVVVHFALELVQADGGTIRATPQAASYAPGSVVRLDLTTEPGYAFVGWGGALTGNANPAQITMDANKRVEANFVATGGTVNFANRVLSLGIDAPVYDEDGTTPLAGAAFLAQLYGGPIGGVLAPAGKPVPFVSGGYFSGGKTVIPSVQGGQRARVQVRVWEAAAGSTYEQARLQGKFGTSAVLELTTGGDLLQPPTFPASLVGLRSFNLERGQPPVITQQPTDAQGLVGANLELSVSATGTDPLSYQWRHNGTDLPGATADRLTLTGITPAADGLYEVTVRNDFGNALSRPARVTVLVPPTFASQPQDQTVFVGETVTLNTTATGSAPLSYQWFRGSSGDSTVPVGQGTSFTSPTLDSSTAYWVRVSNVAGSVNSRTAVITVVRRPQTTQFNPIPGRTFGDPPVTLQAAASSGLPVSFALVSGPATLTGNQLTLTGAGTVVVRALQPGNAAFEPAAPVEQPVVVGKATATIQLAQLTQPFDGSPKPVSARSTPPNLSMLVTYAGSPNAPSALGQYPVEATIQEANYQGSANATLTIEAIVNVEGLVFEDTNGDGTPADTEPGLPNVEVRLLSADGATLLQSAVTASDGTYSFKGVAAGPYVVEEIDPPGYVSTSPNQRSVSVPSGSSVTARFGDQRAGRISGLVYLDLNGNGTQDSGEIGIPGVRISLTGATVNRSATTLAGGTYEFVNLPADSYTVEEIDPVGYASTTPNRRTVNLPAGGSANANFGDQEVGTIVGVVFDDLNGNGVKDAGEQGVGDVEIQLRATGYLSSASTAIDGSYAFADLLPGTYSVEETQPAGYASTTPDRVIVTLSSAGAASVNFGEQALSSISGMVFEDTNGNGLREANESGLAGVTLRLLGGASELTAQTTPEGTYLFSRVPAGTYTVEEFDPVGFTSTTPNRRSVTLTAGSSATANFGDQATGTIAGIVFADLDGDGQRQAWENGIAGVTVRLLGGSETLTRATTSDGTYSFASIAPGNYTVEETDPPGFISTTPNQRSVTLTTGGAATANFGDQAVGTVSGMVYNDTNGNGLNDTGEPGLGGVLITLRDPNSSVSTRTAGDGTYSFANVVPGTYSIEETDPPGYASTSPNQRTLSVASAAGATASFGDQLVGSIGGAVYEDLNGNGLKDAGERGLAAVTVQLRGLNLNQTAQTSGDGTFLFEGLLAGAYTLEETDPPGFTSTTSNQRTVSLASGAAATASFGDQAVGTLSGVAFNDANGNGIQDAGEPGLGGVSIALTGAGVNLQATTTGDGSFTFANLNPGLYTLTETDPGGFVSTTPNQRTVNLASGGAATVAFGDQPTGTVSGIVFNDANGDGILNPGEAGLGGVMVRLVPADASPRTTTTSGDGAFAFREVSAGTYELEEEDPPGFASTTPNVRVLSVAAGGSASANFGDQPLQTITGTVFEDLNGNGRQDAGEPGVPNVAMVLIRNTDGAMAAETLTDPTGVFTFANVPAGDYTVREKVPAGYTTLTGAQTGLRARLASTLLNDGNSVADLPVSLEGASVASVHFANNVVGTLSGVVFEDTNGNGDNDPGEPAIAGAILELLVAGQTTPVATATSTGNGAYLFGDVSPGTYTVRQRPLEGYLLLAGQAALVLEPNGAATANFANQVAGTITGRVYHDENGSGTQEVLELGLGGVTLKLTHLATAQIRSATTAGDGSFRFASLPAGLYAVEETDPAAFHSTTPNRLELTLTIGGAASANFGDQSDQLQPPVITQQPQGATANLGTTVTFSVTASGTAPLGYVWFFNGFAIEGATAPQLELANVTYDATGDYRVSISNRAGKTTSATIHLEVQSLDPYTLWAKANQLPANASGPNDDADRDGLKNMLEFALGLPPMSPSTQGLPTAELVGQLNERYLALRFERGPDTQDVTFVLLGSDNVFQWQEIPSVLQVVSESPDGRAVLRLRDARPTHQAGWRFYRLEVRYPNR